MRVDGRHLSAGPLEERKRRLADLVAGRADPSLKNTNVLRARAKRFLNWRPICNSLARESFRHGEAEQLSGRKMQLGRVILQIPGVD